MWRLRTAISGARRETARELQSALLFGAHALAVIEAALAGDQADAAEGSPARPSCLRPPTPSRMRSQIKPIPSRPFRDLDSERHASRPALGRSPTTAGVADLPPAMGAARRKPTPERGWWISQRRQDGLRPSIGAAEAFQSGYSPKVDGLAAPCLNSAREKHGLAAGPAPAVGLVQDKRHGRVPPITVPAKLPAQRASDEVRNAERRPIDMDAPCQPAILILPGLGPYGR